MASIVVDNVTIDLPIYGSSHRSLRKTLFARTGGLIRREGERRKRVVVRALDNISFTLEHGDRVGLIGHNGAGKTTLLRALAGVYRPSAGVIRREGTLSPLFNAAPGLDTEDSGYENIISCGMFLGMSKAEIQRKMPDIESFCELGEYLALPVRTYSAGMLTRLSFALATALDPGILLLDEGLAAGDARFSARAARRMQALIERSSILVVASHSEGIISQMCSKVIVLEKGRILGIGPIREMIELYHRRNAEIDVAAAPASVPAPEPEPAPTPEPAPDPVAEPAPAVAPTAEASPAEASPAEIPAVAAPEPAIPDQAPSEAAAPARPGDPVQLIYRSVHAISAVMPSDPERIGPWGGSSILGYHYEPKEGQRAIKLRVNANAYSIDDNEVVIAVFRDGNSIPLAYRVSKVKAGEYALFDLDLDVSVAGARGVSFDVRIGPALPGQIVINGPESGLRVDVPVPALNIWDGHP
ncbi:MAG TPA: ATP-binding cassette domain-containing protein [Alphaproteobacteria bacterium]|nr:ATP-binding cassette domain-containing protein [Alphaproteobacteria bacterium]